MAFVLPALAAAGLGGSVAAGTTGIAGASSLAAASLPAIAGISTASAPLIGASWMSVAGLGLTAASGVVGAAGALESGAAQKASADYNAQVASMNQAKATQNAVQAGQAASEQASNQSLKTRALIGSLGADEAAKGVDVNSGSALDVKSSAAELGELDALTIRSNATKEAYGYQVQAQNFGAQSELDTSQGQADETTGIVNAGNTLLGSAGSAATNFARYQLAGGFGGGSF